MIVIHSLVVMFSVRTQHVPLTPFVINITIGSKPRNIFSNEASTRGKWVEFIRKEPELTPQTTCRKFSGMQAVKWSLSTSKLSVRFLMLLAWWPLRTDASRILHHDFITSLIRLLERTIFPKRNFLTKAERMSLRTHNLKAYNVITILLRRGFFF